MISRNLFDHYIILGLFHWELRNEPVSLRDQRSSGEKKAGRRRMRAGVGGANRRRDANGCRSCTIAVHFENGVA